MSASKESERTFVMIKPDGVQRGLVGGIIGRFEGKSYLHCNLLRIKLITIYR